MAKYKRRGISSIIAPAIFTAGMGYFATRYNGFGIENPNLGDARAIIATGFLIAAGWLIWRLLDVFFWGGVIEKRVGHAAPRLLVDLVRAILAIIVFVCILTLVFQQPINGLIVSSGVLGIVLGIALQRMILDFFSGIALNVEKPFRVGEWINVNGIDGRVNEVTWRATYLVTLDQTMVIIPNSELSQSTVINYEHPEGFFRTKLAVALEYGVTIEDASRVLLGAVCSTAGLLEHPAPDVVVTSFGADGIEYQVRWFVSSFTDVVHSRSRVAAAVNRALYFAGMGVPFPKRDVYYSPMPEREISREDMPLVMLKRTDLFASLDETDIQTLAQSMTHRLFDPRQTVVKQGDSGESLFIVADGLLDVHVQHEGKPLRRVARLTSGQFFGEMSLLTGDPRTATVTTATACSLYELDKSSLESILTSRPAIAKTLSHAVAARQLQTQQATATTPHLVNDDSTGLAHQLLRRINQFFKLPL